MERWKTMEFSSTKSTNLSSGVECLLSFCRRGAHFQCLQEAQLSQMKDANVVVCGSSKQRCLWGHREQQYVTWESRHSLEKAGCGTGKEGGKNQTQVCRNSRDIFKNHT